MSRTAHLTRLRRPITGPGPGDGAGHAGRIRRFPMSAIAGPPTRSWRTCGGAWGRALRFVFRNFPLTQIHPHAYMPRRRPRPPPPRASSGRCTACSSSTRTRSRTPISSSTRRRSISTSSVLRASSPPRRTPIEFESTSGRAYEAASTARRRSSSTASATTAHGKRPNCSRRSNPPLRPSSRTEGSSNVLTRKVATGLRAARTSSPGTWPSAAGGSPPSGNSSRRRIPR